MAKTVHNYSVRMPKGKRKNWGIEVTRGFKPEEFMTTVEGSTVYVSLYLTRTDLEMMLDKMDGKKKKVKTKKKQPAPPQPRLRLRHHDRRV